MTGPLLGSEPRSPGRLTTIRARLWGGFATLVALLLLAGALGYRSLRIMASSIDTTLESVQEESRLSAELASNIAREIQAAARYVDSRDLAAQSEFRRLG